MRILINNYPVGRKYYIDIPTVTEEQVRKEQS